MRHAWTMIDHPVMTGQKSNTFLLSDRLTRLFPCFVNRTQPSQNPGQLASKSRGKVIHRIFTRRRSAKFRWPAEREIIMLISIQSQRQIDAA
jgi:hypothetical protein